MIAVEILDEKLRAAGIPIHGVSCGLDGGPVGARIDFSEKATDQHRKDALAILDAFDWKDTAPREPPAIIVDLGKIDSAAREQLIDWCLADYLRRVPDAAKKLGIDVPGEEAIAVAVESVAIEARIG